jgi:hypothetical protein
MTTVESIRKLREAHALVFVESQRWYGFLELGCSERNSWVVDLIMALICIFPHGTSFHLPTILSDEVPVPVSFVHFLIVLFFLSVEL